MQRAADIFQEDVLAEHLHLNAAWLQARPRRSDQIHDALFPEYLFGGMTEEEIRVCLNRAIWDAGYTPDMPTFNPEWHWREGIHHRPGQNMSRQPSDSIEGGC